METRKPVIGAPDIPKKSSNAFPFYLMTRKHLAAVPRDRHFRATMPTVTNDPLLKVAASTSAKSAKKKKAPKANAKGKSKAKKKAKK